MPNPTCATCGSPLPVHVAARDELGGKEVTHCAMECPRCTSPREAERLADGAEGEREERLRDQLRRLLRALHASPGERSQELYDEVDEAWALLHAHHVAAPADAGERGWEDAAGIAICRLVGTRAPLCHIRKSAEFRDNAQYALDAVDAAVDVLRAALRRAAAPAGRGEGDSDG